MVLLTGDVLSVSKSIASALNFDMVRSELSPDGKLSAIRYLKQGLGDRATLAYVGDGINDAALFDEAHVGVSLDTLRHDDGTDKADVAVMSGEIRRLPALLRIAVAAWKAVLQNIVLCCAVKALLLILALCGAAPIAICAAADALCVVLTELTLVPDIGAITAGFITEWFSKPQSLHQIRLLRDAGVDFSSHEEKKDDRFAGMTFVLTGALQQFTRDEASALIESFGGKASSSVSKKTSYVADGEARLA